MFDNLKILVVAAHPDDEVLGCGGTLSKFSARNAEISVLILGEGLTSRHNCPAGGNLQKSLEDLKKQANLANNDLGVNKLIMRNLPDNRFDSVDLLDIVKEVEKVKHEYAPNIIFTHHPGDLNIDHELTYRAVMTTFRPLPKSTPVAIYSFEILSSTEYAANSTSGTIFAPNTYISLQEEEITSKIKSFEHYSSEIQPEPHPRSINGIRNLAKLRGQQVGSPYAEAFILLRQTII